MIGSYNCDELSWVKNFSTQQGHVGLKKLSNPTWPDPYKPLQGGFCWACWAIRLLMSLVGAYLSLFKGKQNAPWRSFQKKKKKKLTYRTFTLSFLISCRNFYLKDNRKVAKVSYLYIFVWHKIAITDMSKRLT